LGGREATGGSSGGTSRREHLRRWGARWGYNNPLGGSTPPYRLRGLGRHASRLCRPGHHRGYEVSVTRVAND